MARNARINRQRQKPSLEDEIAHLRDLDLKGLRVRWQGIFKRQAPSHLPRHLLFGVLAYRLQAAALGDLDAATIRLLKQIAAGGTKMDSVALTAEFDHRRSELKPGTILMREWNGRPERVRGGVTRVGTVHSFGIGLGNSEPEPVGGVRNKQNRSGKRAGWHSSFHLCVATAARALLRSCRFVERFTWRGGTGCRTWPPLR